ncbi:GtrA family protein [Acidobacteriota bacterium]
MNSLGYLGVFEKWRGLLPQFLGKNNSAHIQLFRYAVVGGCAYTLDFGALYFLTDYLHIHYLISAAAAFSLGLITNYFLSIYWVFSKRSVSNRQTEFLLFALIGMVGLGFNEGIMWLFTGLASFHYLVSKLFSTVLVFIWNFFARKKILFS